MGATWGEKKITAMFVDPWEKVGEKVDGEKKWL